MTDSAMAQLSVSVVVPLYDEADSVAPLVEAVHAALGGAPFAWELILVDDGSRDSTLELALEERNRRGPHLSVLPLRRNFGQTAAMQAGLDAARGSICVTLDGDLQNDPADIVPMVERLVTEDLDLIVGWRRSRQDGLWLRKIPSLLANKLIRRVTGVRVHDYAAAWDWSRLTCRRASCVPASALASPCTGLPWTDSTACPTRPSSCWRTSRAIACGWRAISSATTSSLRRNGWRGRF